MNTDLYLGESRKRVFYGGTLLSTFEVVFEVAGSSGKNKLDPTVFQGFGKAKSAHGGSILSSSQFLILPQLPQKIKLASKVVKVNSKIIILLPTI